MKRSKLIDSIQLVPSCDTVWKREPAYHHHVRDNDVTSLSEYIDSVSICCTEPEKHDDFNCQPFDEIEGVFRIDCSQMAIQL